MARPTKGDLEKKFEARYLVLDLPDRERLTTYKVAERFMKDYRIPQLDHSTVSRWVRKVDDLITHDPEVARAYEEWKTSQGSKGKIFYRIDPVSAKITSDYPTVQKYADRIVNEEKSLETLVSNLKMAEKCWLYLDQKDPRNWTDEEVERYLREGRSLSRKPLTIHNKNQYKIACRQVAPNVKAVEGGTLKHKKNIRDKIPVIKSPVFHREFTEVIRSGVLTDFECFVYKLHNLIGCREGGRILPESEQLEVGRDSASLTGMQWTDYDPRNETLRVYESKAVGWWNGIPLRKLSPFFDPGFADEFRRYWEGQGKPASGLMLPEMGATVAQRYAFLTKLYGKIKRNFEFTRRQKFTPHFGRKTHANILWEADVDPLLIIGDASTHSAPFGAGETDMTTYRIYYLDFAKGKLEKEYAKAGVFR